jgi:esterase/lipase
MDVTPLKNPSLRLSRRYRFDDRDMDLFFVAALGWGPAGGLDVGQAFYVASHIEDGDADSWVKAFADYGDRQNTQADTWKNCGWQRQAVEARLKAFASYRSAWQFAPLGNVFDQLYANHQIAFRAAMTALEIPAAFFDIPYQGKHLPGVFFKNDDDEAPVVLVIGGSDTCCEDLFLTVGRSLLDRGYSVAIADLPGQGNLAAQDMHWEVESERSIGAIVDALVAKFSTRSGRIALLGLSLGGYFVTRAAGYEHRFATVMASTPFSNPGEMFGKSVSAAVASGEKPTANSPAWRNRAILAWKAGAQRPQDLAAMTVPMVADPALVTVPFLSIMGAGESPIFASQAKAWHAAIRSERKSLVVLDDSTGADGHCQVNNRLRLVQEVSGWLDELFDRRTRRRGVASARCAGDP